MKSNKQLVAPYKNASPLPGTVQDVPAGAPAAGPLHAAGSHFSNQPLVATRSPLPQTLYSSQLYPPYLHSQAAVPLPKRPEPAVCGQSLSQQPAAYRVMGLPSRVPQTSSLSQQQVLRPLAPHPWTVIAAPLTVPQREPAAPQRRGDFNEANAEGESVAERVVRFIRYGRERMVAALGAQQREHSDGSRRKDGSRGAGNQPRGIWAMRDVQELVVEVMGKCGLDLYDEDGELRVNPRSKQPFQNLPKKYAQEARDLVEALLLNYHAGDPAVTALLEAAEVEGRTDGHFLQVETVRRQCISIMDRLLGHMDALQQVGQPRFCNVSRPASVICACLGDF
jgi:hypothetical protein